MSGPYYTGGGVTLWHGDARDVLPHLPEQPSSCVTDPPYGETSAVWDVWPTGWVDAVSAALPPDASLWCFGSARMFLTHRDDFARWRYAQELLWVKPRVTAPTGRDRLGRVHEWAYHWYRGRWGLIHHEWHRDRVHGSDKSHTGTATVPHWGFTEPNTYIDDGTRQPLTVTHLVESPSVRGRARHQDEKPLAVVVPLVRECTRPGGLVLDPFAGTGTTGEAARMTGRRAVLVEADEAMCEVAATRLSEDHLDLWGA